MTGLGKESEIADVAVEFFTKSRSSTWSPADKARLQAWVEQDPTHAQTYRAMEKLWGGLYEVQHEPAMLAMREEARRASSRSIIRRMGAGLLAAGLAVGAFGLWDAGLLSWDVWRGPGYPPAAYTTRVGQMSTIALPDGSTAILDAKSAIRFSERLGVRRVDLLEGRALFKVHKDVRRPFVVHAGGKTITALGTKFDVYLRGSSLIVDLAEGKVEVAEVSPRTLSLRTARPTVMMTAGYRLTAGEAAWNLKPLSPDASLAWLEGRMVFDDTPVDQIVAEVNRYTDLRITIADRSIEQTRMTAVLQTKDAETFLASLEMLKVADVHRTATGVVLTRPER